MHSLLEKKNPIQADVKGCIAVPFDTMLELYESPSMLLRIQQIYRDYMVGTEGVEFEVVEVKPNFYEYVNRHEELTVIEECFRLKSNTDQFDLVLYTAGYRFFGAYEAVIHVQLERALDASLYRAFVYAYPQNGFSRFFGRYLGLIERFFDKKTTEMEMLTVEIVQYMHFPKKED
ncbi:MAG: hypothetical protein ACJZ86_04345 [Pontiellaceae bacterium]